MPPRRVMAQTMAAELTRLAAVYATRRVRGLNYNTVIDVGPNAIPHAGDRGPYKRRGTLKQTNKDIRNIKKLMNKDMARHTFRRRDIAEVGPASEGLVSHDSFTANNQPLLEAAMVGFRYFDPATPGTLVTAASGTGTYQRDVHVKSLYTKILIRNNYQVPCTVTLYLCTNKSDTDITVNATLTNGMTDQNNPTINSPLIHLTDSDQFNDLYAVKKYKKVHLDVGKEFSLGYGKKDFWYDPSLNDSHGLNFQARWGACQWHVKVEGVLGHDSGAAVQEVNTLRAGVDLMIDTKYVFEYDAGVNLNDFSIDNNATASFNGTTGVCANKAVADLQGFSAT